MLWSMKQPQELPQSCWHWRTQASSLKPAPFLARSFANLPKALNSLDERSAKCTSQTDMFQLCAGQAHGDGNAGTYRVSPSAPVAACQESKMAGEPNTYIPSK